MLSRPKSAKFDKTIDKIDKVCYNGIIGPEKGEYFDVLDSNGHKTGRIKLRSEVHRDGDWHRAVNIWIVNGGGCFLVADISLLGMIVSPLPCVSFLKNSVLSFLLMRSNI